MEERNGYDDEKIPTEENIEEMNRAYAELLSPQTKHKICTFMKNVSKHNYSICMLDYGIIADIYRDELRMIAGLQRLSQYARLMSTRETIARVIGIKNRILRTLGHLLNHGTSCLPTLDSRATNKVGYNALYLELESIEIDIMTRLESARGLTYILIHESAAAYILSTLTP